MVTNKSISNLLGEIETIPSYLASSVRRLSDLAKHGDGEVRMRSIEAMACLRWVEASVDSCIAGALVSFMSPRPRRSQHGAADRRQLPSCELFLTRVSLSDPL